MNIGVAIPPQANVTGDDAIINGKIVLAYLEKCQDYYARLAKMAGEAEAAKN
jgi:hypothetical protein